MTELLGHCPRQKAYKGTPRSGQLNMWSEEEGHFAMLGRPPSLGCLCSLIQSPLSRH